MLLSFGFYMPKRSAKRNSDAYKPTAGENSSTHYLKTSVKKEASPLATLYYTCTRRIECLSNV